MEYSATYTCAAIDSATKNSTAINSETLKIATSYSKTLN